MIHEHIEIPEKETSTDTMQTEVNKNVAVKTLEWFEGIVKDSKIDFKIHETTNDMVNHPHHYTSDPSGVECIAITRHRNFNIGNAIKYLWRAGLKGSDTNVEDLNKAVWYIVDEIHRLGGHCTVHTDNELKK